MRQSTTSAIANGATAADLAVLLGVFIWTASYSRLSDQVAVSQIAQAAGLWNGEGDCPRSVRNRVADRLARLDSYGAIVYQPGSGRRGSYVSIPVGTDAAKSPVSSDSKSPLSSDIEAPLSSDIDADVSHLSEVTQGHPCTPGNSPLRGDHPRSTPRRKPSSSSSTTHLNASRVAVADDDDDDLAPLWNTWAHQRMDAENRRTGKARVTPTNWLAGVAANLRNEHEDAVRKLLDAEPTLDHVRIIQRIEHGPPNGRKPRVACTNPECEGGTVVVSTSPLTCSPCPTCNPNGSHR